MSTSLESVNWPTVDYGVKIIDGFVSVGQCKVRFRAIPSILGLPYAHIFRGSFHRRHVKLHPLQIKTNNCRL